MLITLLLATTVQTIPDLAPGTRYDEAIPTLSEVVGHDFGEEVTPPRDLVRYFEALAEAAPDRVRLVRYAESWEGRPLIYAAIASPERIARLEEVKGGLARLADPRGLPPAEAERLVRELPVVTWLLHGVHGNEISSSGAAMALAYHLLAAVGDETVETILRESIVLIDPMENPDGRARFVHHNLLARAALPDPHPASAEHDEPWPRGRANHYLFDMNRDWIALTQPETVGRVRTALEWFPQVVVDLHEMGGEATYYFAPPAEPLNPYVTDDQRRWLETFGRAIAERFDERGFAYFTREIYDSFYPGYGESWPIFQGAIGMTFEQASARSLLYRRDGDGQLLRYADGVIRHFTSALATAATAARHRGELLAYFHEYRRSAVALGESGPVREYLIAPGADPARAGRLAHLLAAQGIEVDRLDQGISVGSRRLPAGSYRVSLAQPNGRLARNLLDTAVEMSEEFVAEQDRRRKKRLPDQFYDLTGWSLPLLFDVDVVPSGTVSGGDGERLTAERDATSPALAAARVGYLIPWGVGAAAAIGEALRDGIAVRRADAAFTLGGRELPAGTVIVRVPDNGPDLRQRLGRIAGRHGVEVVPADSGWVDAGISLGSGRIAALRSPRILLGWDEPTSSSSAGWARYVLERRYELPVTIVRIASLPEVNLADFDVVVLPSGDYRHRIDDRLVGRLGSWMRSGGTLVTIGEASRWAARESVGLLKTPSLLRDGTPEKDPDAETDAEEPSEARRAVEEPFDVEKAIQPEEERPETTPGALLRVELDREHWLTSGLDGEIQAIVEGRRVFAPIRLDAGRNVGLYSDAERLVASGLAWPEARELLARRAFLVHQPEGEGHLVAFAEDPNYRGLAEATQLLFVNAVLLGPAH
jgi:hypothetical protein